MSTKHTKGPWAIGNLSSDPKTTIIHSQNLIIATMQDYKPAKGMAEFWKGTSEANAKLIAAAPELLEACLMYRQLIMDEGCIPDMEQIKLTELMWDAIKKATV